jgi:triacylglycerol lipase
MKHRTSIIWVWVLLIFPFGEVRAAETRHPIILAHGIAPFNYGLRRVVSWLPRKWQARLGTDSCRYFKNIQKTLRAKGYEVHTTHVSYASSVEQRAGELKAAIQQVMNREGHDKVHIFAHSMGGLDARQMINEEGMADSVCSLTTIGTPHRGTIFADFGLDNGGQKLVRWFGKALRGFENLRTDWARAFNRQHEEAEAKNGVTYRVVATTQPPKKIFLPIRLAAKLIGEKEGRNDGLVSKKSALFTTELRTPDGSVTKKVQDLSDLFPEGDHLNQIGHSDGEGRRWFWPSTWKLRAAYERKIIHSWVKLAEGLRAIENSQP